MGFTLKKTDKEAMRISKIILDNFRGYSHAEIEFNRFNCIVGKNDVGKSTIFEAIKWFLDSSQNNADNEFNIQQLQHAEEYEGEDEYGNSIFTGEPTPIIVSGYTMSVEVRFCEIKDIKTSIDSIFSEKYYLNFIKLIVNTNDFLNENNELCIKKEINHSFAEESLFVEEDKKKPTYQIFAKSLPGQSPISFWNQKLLIEKYVNIFGNDDENIKSLNNALNSDDLWNKLLLPKASIRDIHNSTPYFEIIINKIREHHSKKNDYKLKWFSFDRSQTDFLSIIPKFRYFNSDSFDSEYNSVVQDYVNSFIQQQKSFDDIQNCVSKEFKPISEVFNRTIKNNNLTLVPKVTCKFNVQFEFSNGLDSISLKSRGEGIQRVLMNILFRYISNKETGDESIFVFEEPESHLHPEAQKTFFDTLIELSTKYNQVFITTHSPSMVLMCDAKDVIHIKKENDYPKVYQNDNTSLQEVIEDLGIGPNDTMLSLYDEYKSILFVEGKNDIYTLNKISELYKKEGIVEQTINEMKCLIIPVGGCSTVEEWSNFGIVTKLAKPFAILLDSDKKTEEHESKNQTKLDSVFASLDSSNEESKKIKMKLNKENFMLTRKRELENYIMPRAIENYYNLKKCNKDEKWKYEDIDEILSEFKDYNFVTFSIVKYVYDNEHKVFRPKLDPIIQKELNNLTNNEEKKDKIYQIHKKNSVKSNVLEKIKQYINDFTEFHPKKFDSKFEEWIYCKEKGINIDSYDKYQDIIGIRSFIYCLEKGIAIVDYEKIYNQCRWIGTNYYYLITYLLNKENIKFEISSFSTKEQFKNSLDDVLKGKLETIKEEIIKTTIPDEYTEIHFGDDINWKYIDVPRAIYYQKKHKDYTEDDDDIKQECEEIKKRINKFFFEEGNINFEDLDFSYGDNQDEFLDIYNKIKLLSE